MAIRVGGKEGTAGKGVIACRLATVAALAAYTRTTNKLEANANGALATIDSVAPAVNDYVLLTKGAAGADNGPYKVTSLGAAGSKWTMERVPELDTSAEAIPGMVIEIAEGTQYGGIEFSLLTTGAIVLNTTTLTFGFSGAVKAPEYKTNWADFEPTGNQAGRYRKTRDGLVVVEGAIKNATSATAEKPIFILPEGFRPAKRRVVSCFDFDKNFVRIDIAANGEVLYMGLTEKKTFVSIEFSFFID